MISDVLVFCPVLRLEPETVAAIGALRWSGPLSVLYQLDNPHDGDNAGVANHLHQYQRGRETFLAGRYDAMLVIESDIIPPPDTLTRLAAIGADVAYGAYAFRSNPKVVNIFERYDPPAANIGESLSLYPAKWAAAKRAGVVPCSGAGLGCVLIARRVLEAVQFRALSMALNPRVHCDSWFTTDVFNAGYTMMADTAVRCGHKTPEGAILWPA